MQRFAFLQVMLDRYNKSTIACCIQANSADVSVIFTSLLVLPHQNSPSPNKKQTNPSRYGSDLSVLAPATGLEFQIQL